MKFKSTLILCFLLVFQLGKAQKTLNNYAYVIIPDQFSFQDSKDQYQLNSLTQFLLEKEGFKVFLDTERIPQEYALMDCAGLKLKMNKKPSMFRSKLDFSLSDCYNTIVFTSELGSSSEKNYKKGYQESIRNAFKSLSAINYTYTPIPAANIPVKARAVSVLEKKAITLSNSEIYANDANLVIELTKTNGSYIGKVKSSVSIEYSIGDIVCKLFKTSLPNVFKAQWKDSSGDFINTIAYFNENKELNIDFSAPTGVTVIKFKKQ